ncbi:hypothetical protein HYW18_00840 [Candidatus Uhrbacteria bacterium]|nr:hypothetical protein [Candidatus Uhrbacteria bacterium]
MKKTFLAVILVAILLPAGIGRADNPTWQVLTATDVWDRGTHRVERLDLPRIVEGPLNLGDNVVVQTVASSCVSAACDERDAYILRNGSAIRVPNVPKSALSLAEFNANGGRVVWAVPVPSDTGRWDVIELDLASGQKVKIAGNFFLGNVETMKVRVADGEIFLNPTFISGGNTFKNAGVFRYDRARGDVVNVTQRFNAQHEELLDVDLANNRILTKMSFASGEKQLWLTKITSEYLNGEANRIIGTWTPAHEDLVGGHFRPDGSVEYFRMYTRSLSSTNGVVDTFQTTALGEQMSWYRPASDAVTISGDNMVWINNDNELTVSNEQFGTIRVGTIGPRAPRVVGTDVYFATPEGMGMVYRLKDGVSTLLDYMPTDRFKVAMVGVDEAGTVRFGSTKNPDESISMGVGTDAALSDERHVYWRGVDGAIYEATLSTDPGVSTTGKMEAVKVENNPTVFLTDGVNRWTFTNEDVYRTWFDSMDTVKTISATRLAYLRDRGTAQFAPGTKVKAKDDARLYVVGRDNKAHWIVNETVADAVFGSSWNKDVKEIDTAAMVSYQQGRTIDDALDIDLI